MAKLITKFKYLKPSARQSVGGYAKYIATREGVEKVDDTFKTDPSTEKPKKLIEKILRDFPDSNSMLEYEDYLKEPNDNGDQTITRSVEVQHLQTPDYWLTCVLISVMAWRNDDKELADRAMDRAIKLDKKNSAIFYMLFNLRMGREEAALKWFYTYQECDLKGSDQRTFLMLFSLVSKTLVDTVDERTKDEVFTFIKKVVDANM